MLTIDRQADRLAALAVAQQRAMCSGHSHRATRLGRLVIRAARLYRLAVTHAADRDGLPVWLRRQATPWGHGVDSSRPSHPWLEP